MKAIKISLIVIVLALLSIFAIRSIITPPPSPEGISVVGKISPSIANIEKEIASIRNLPDNKFRSDAFQKVLYLISESYTPHPPQYPYGRLGNTQLDNDQQKENLTKNLYSVYSEKFIDQSFYVFKNTAWAIEDLNFIRAEKKKLRSSPYLERGSPVDNRFNLIQVVLQKHDEINNFVSACNSYTFRKSFALSEHFPIDDAHSKILKSRTYLNNGLENSYVKNCTRLHSGLNGVSQVIFMGHTRYLDDKINKWSNQYKNYNSHREYTEILFSPMKNQIDALDNNIYNAGNFSKEYNRLLNRWNADNLAAYNHFNQ